MNDTQRQQTLSRIDSSFGHWFAGFLDGEGYFQIMIQGESCETRVVIMLREDDLPTLQLIRDTLQIGDIYQISKEYDRRKTGRRSRDQVGWFCRTNSDGLQLATLLDNYPLRSKKKRDYAFWREATLLVARFGRTPPGDVLSRLKELDQQQKECRRLGTFDFEETSFSWEQLKLV